MRLPPGSHAGVPSSVMLNWELPLEPSPYTSPSPASPDAMPAVSDSSARASPNSSTFTAPSGRSFTFAGLRSRWTMSCSCAYSSASASWRATPSASSGGSGPHRMGCAQEIAGGVKRAGLPRHARPLLPLGAPVLPQ
jgi:hypothetical protein